MIPWQSLILIWACAGNPSAPANVNPDPLAAGCQRDHWGYTEPVLDFQSASDCNTAGHRMTQQNPHVYATWRCVADPNKPPPGEQK